MNSFQTGITSTADWLRSAHLSQTLTNAAEKATVTFLNRALAAAQDVVHSEAFDNKVNDVVSITKTENFEDGMAATTQYAKDHPALVTGIAIQAGTLVVLGPAALALPLKVIGFGGSGAALGSAAAAWQSTAYGAYIPAGSIFAFCQSVGMKATWLHIFATPIGSVIAGAGAWWDNKFNSTVAKQSRPEEQQADAPDGA